MVIIFKLSIINMNPIDSGSRVRQPESTLSREEVEERLRYRNMRKKYIQRQVKNIAEYLSLIISGFAVVIVCLLAHCTLARSLAYYTLEWTLFNITKIVRFIIYLRKPLTPTKKKHIIVSIIKYLLSSIGTIQMFILSYRSYGRAIVSIMIPLAISCFLPLVVFIKSTNTCFTILKTIKTIVSFIRLFMVLLILMTIYY